VTLGVAGAGAVVALGPGDILGLGLNKSSGGSDGGGEGSGNGDPTTPPPPDFAGMSRTLIGALPDVGSEVPDLKTVDLKKTTDLDVAYVRTTAARGLTEAADICAGKLLRERLARGDDATLTVTSRVIATGKNTIGLLLDVTDEEGPFPILVWYRGKKDRPCLSTGLIKADEWSTFGDAVLEAATQVPGADADQLGELLCEQPRPFGNGPALLPAADGSLSVLFPSADRDGSRGELGLTLPAETVADLLSGTGEAVMKAFASPATFDPDSVSIPDPDTHSGDEVYSPPKEIDSPQAARSSKGPGPLTQLAPRVEDGERPAIVVAPDATRLNALSLTFDDGPAPDLNDQLLDTLRENNAAVTFFMIGQSAAEWPDLVANTAAAGQEVGNHSWSHKQLNAVGADTLDDQIRRPTETLEKAGGRPVLVMRPPYGARNSSVDDKAGEFQQSVQIWDVDSLDWQTRNTQKDIEAIQSGSHRGALILMHEIHQPTVDAVPTILDWFAENDYTTLTTSELGQNQMYAGKNYMRGLIAE
jgi:peptidoglycan/xylan/chitin deacetylase (PgdA/CDA1 family)